MKTRKLIAALALALTIGLVGCGSKEEPKNPDDPKPVDPTDPEEPKGENPFIGGEGLADKYAEKFAQGKYVITACGYEGISQIENWITALGVKKVSDTDATNKSSGQVVSNKLVDLSTIPEDYVILLGVAYTGKGLKDGGTTKEKEIARSNEIAGLDNDIIVFATVGASNRGTVCDELLGNILPNCVACIVKENTNTDKFFTNAQKDNDFALCVGETAGDMKAGLEYLGFKK